MVTGMVVNTKDKAINLGYLTNLLNLREVFQFDWGGASLTYIYHLMDYITYH